MLQFFNNLIGYPDTPTVFYPYDYFGSIFVTFLFFSIIVYIIISIFRR